MLRALEMIHCIKGEDLDSVAAAYGLPSRVVKQELFGGDLETDESLRNRILDYVYCKLVKNNS